MAGTHELFGSVKIADVSGLQTALNAKAGRAAVRAVAASTTAVVGEVLEVSAPSAAVVITPPAAPVLGDQVTLVRTDAPVYSITWNGTVNNDTGGVALVAQWAVATLFYDGAAWTMTGVNAPVSVGSDSLIYRAVCSAIVQIGQNASSDVTGLSVTVTSRGLTDSFVVEGILDMRATANNVSTIVGQLLVDGTVVTGQIIFCAPVNNLRHTSSQSWTVTRLPAGTHVFKMTVFTTNEGLCAYEVNALHSSMTITRSSAPVSGTVYNAT